MGRNITPVVKYLLIINVGLFLIEYLIKVDLSELFGFGSFGTEHFQPFQIITYMFLHDGIGHLFSNMLGLFFLGPFLERVLDSKKFLIYYMATGIGAGILFASVDFIEKNQIRNDANQYLSNPSPQGLIEFTGEHFPYYIGKEFSFIQEGYPSDPNNLSKINRSKQLVIYAVDRLNEVKMVGASGAIFGIIIAFGLLFPNLELMLIFPPFPIKAKYFALFYGIFSVYSLLENRPDDNVAHLAHLGGMLFGYLMIKYWKMKPYM